MAPLPAVLGINLWLVTLVVPVLLSHRDTSAWFLGALGLCPLVLLGALARPRSALAPALLLLTVPLLVLIPGTDGFLADSALHPRAAVPVQGLVLLAYLGAVCRELARATAVPAPAAAGGEEDFGPPEWNLLPAQEVPLRWRRRIALYRGFFALSLAGPALFLYAIDFHPAHLRALRAAFGGTAGAVQAAFTAAAALLWVVLFHFCLVGPLRAHLLHDRDTAARTGALRSQAQRGRPRPYFYLAMFLSLVSMILLILRSLRP